MLNFELKYVIIYILIYMSIMSSFAAVVLYATFLVAVEQSIYYNIFYY